VIGRASLFDKDTRGQVSVRCSMKFCRLDGSGTEVPPIAVMAGVVADANRMHLTKDAWSELLGQQAPLMNSLPALQTRRKVRR